MRNRKLLCLVSVMVLVVAYAALNFYENATVLASQLQSDSENESRLMIVPRRGCENIGAGTSQPRSVDVTSGAVPNWRDPRNSAADPAPRRSVAEVPVRNRASLQRPNFAPASSLGLRNQQPEPNFVHASSNRSLPVQAQYSEDGSLQFSGSDASSYPAQANPAQANPAQTYGNGPGPVPPPPNGFQNQRTTEPDFQPPLLVQPSVVDPHFMPPPFEQQPLVKPLNSGTNFDPDEACDPAVRSDVAAPLPGMRNDHPQTYIAPAISGYAPGTSGFRATVESDAPQWMAPYYGRTDQMPTGVENSPTPAPSVVLPPDFVAWWDPLIRQSAGLAANMLPVEVSTLVQLALEHAPQVQVLQADPEVKYTIAHQEQAAFDWRAFLDAKYSDLNDPVGNVLTTGNGANRFLDNKVFSEGGFKRRTETGGEVRIAQSLGHQYNNSRYLIPNPQVTSRLELSFRQPLMSQAGTVYNQSQIVLANINANITSDESLQELQTHLYNVAEVYWNLYRARSEFFQRQKLLSSAQKVLQTLEARNEVDTIPRQILRARAAVARAESRMQRAVTDIRNAESRLRLLVNDPAMLNSGPMEFIPSESPAAVPSPAGLKETLELALVNRPDISRAIREMRTSSVQIGISKSELLPRLDFLVTTYVAGLQNQSQIADSVVDQFTQARPGYTLGLEFEVPLGRRAAKAKMDQRQWELKRAISVFRVAVETSLTEVEIANREVDTAYREMLGRYQAMVAAQNEVAYLQDRFDVLPAIEDSSMLLLEDLLNGFERLADEESAFAQTQSNYALSIIQLRRATGTLMRSRHATPELDPDESEWMHARAEQTADESSSRAAKTVSFRKTEFTDDVASEVSSPTASSQPFGYHPSTWSQPLGVSPAKRDTLEQSSGAGAGGHDATPSTRPVSVGGHSFGTR
ncbi:MAG TPA: TolC family protein [Planctomycetaceae bacterium]|nr:TolC family protein [Planctomycetaceae bacterium]